MSKLLINHNNSKVSTKTKIFSVAAHLFAKKGFNGVSMREISEQSGVSKPTIYYYFGSKEGIYKELVDTGLAHIFAALEDIRDQNILVRDKLVLFLKGLFRLCLKFPEFANFMLNLTYSSENISFLKKWKDETDRRGKILVNMIEEGVDSGEFGAGANPQLAADIVWGVTAHFIWQQLSSKKRILSDQLAEQIIEMLFKGFNE